MTDKKGQDPEPRLTTRELRARLLEFNRQQPLVMDESEFSEYIDDTTVSRYDRADALFTEIQNELRAIAGRTDPAGAVKLELAIEKIDRGVALMSYGNYGWNKAATGKPRAILWPGRSGSEPNV